jgi:hypothetical protein
VKPVISGRAFLDLRKIAESLIKKFINADKSGGLNWSMQRRLSGLTAVSILVVFLSPTPTAEVLAVATRTAFHIATIEMYLS